MAEVTGNDRRAVESFARMPPEQQDEFLLRMPAHQRQEFIATVETVASDDEGGFLASMIGPLMARIRAGERADKLSERAIRDSTSADTEYVRGVNSSEYNYLSIPHEELQRYAQQDNEPGQIGDVSAGYNDLMSGYEKIHEAITKAVSTLHGSWEGEAASSATDFGDQLARYSERNTSYARLAAEVVARQSDASSSFKNSMPEPKPFSWDAQLAEARSADPISSVSILVEGFDKQRESQEAHQRAAEVASTFDNDTFGSASKQPRFAEPPQFGGSGSGESGGTATSSVGNRSAGTPGVGATSGVGSPGTGTGPGTGSGYSGSPSVAPPGGFGTGSTSPSGSELRPGSRTGVGSPGGFTPGGTAPAGFTPGRYQSPAASSGAGGAGGMGAMPFGPMGGFAGGGDSARGSGGFGAGGGGRGGGFGPGGPGGQGAPGSGQGGLGAGKQAGTGMGGQAAAGAAGAKAGAMGAGGRAGMGGMMGGAGAGKGQGGEDSEHKRKYIQDSEIDVGLTEQDEFGEKMIDSETGLPVVPPVIGG